MSAWFIINLMGFELYLSKTPHSARKLFKVMSGRVKLTKAKLEGCCPSTDYKNYYWPKFSNLICFVSNISYFYCMIPAIFLGFITCVQCNTLNQFIILWTPTIIAAVWIENKISTFNIDTSNILNYYLGCKYWYMNFILGVTLSCSSSYKKKSS